MTSRNVNWHKAWQRLSSGRLRHVSGAEFLVVQGNGYTDFKAAPDTLGQYQSFELARGVPLHDLAERLQRLAREAADWHKFNSKN